MAAGVIFKPGSKYSHCEEDCKHRDCAELRIRYAMSVTRKSAMKPAIIIVVMNSVMLMPDVLSEEIASPVVETG